MLHQTKRAFTLIELLIVVAIIAILAAIAVPNFLEAQVRSKVSRIKSDLRTMATAIESYIVDNNVPPPEAGGATGQGVFAPRSIDGVNNNTGILTPALSTPIAYISNSDLRDVFYTNAGGAAARPDVQLFTYKAYRWEWPGKNKQPNQPIQFNEGAALNGDRFRELYGEWRLFSVGPDRDWDNNPNNPPASFANPASVGLPYDPTNGTLSVGSIIRSQKETEQRTWQMVNGQ